MGKNIKRYNPGTWVADQTGDMGDKPAVGDSLDRGHGWQVGIWGSLSEEKWGSSWAGAMAAQTGAEYGGAARRPAHALEREPSHG